MIGIASRYFAGRVALVTAAAVVLGIATGMDGDGNVAFYGVIVLGVAAGAFALLAGLALAVGDDFVHESIIGSLFRGRIEAQAKVGNHDAIVPSVEGWARITGFNTIFIDPRDPYAHGFQVV